jgi:carboxyl-terminal processing protease
MVLIMKKLLVFLFLFLVNTTSYANKTLNIKSFETVWHTVNEKHYDATFGGLNWKEVHDRYQSKIVSAESDVEFHTLVNKMLFELNLSHFLVVPRNDLKHRLPTLFAEGSIGVDLRLFGDTAVITSVQSESSAAHAGLHPGFVIEHIDGMSIKQIIKESEATLIPPFNSRNRLNRITNEILGRIYGPPNTSVSIVYLDENRERHEQKIRRKGRGPGKVFSDALPAFFIEFKAKRLENNIGYIWFNHFAKPVDVKCIQALESMRDTPGIIIDLRGNSGGFFKTVDMIAKHLLAEKTLFYTFRFRDKTIDKYLTPVDRVYKGPVVVLIDIMSTSASEDFSSCIQVINRGIIVGEHSPGYALVANWMKLPNGAAFMHAIAQFRTPDGTVIEGNGVAPDIEVKLDRNSLLRGIDTQLEEAIKYIKNKMQK